MSDDWGVQDWKWENPAPRARRPYAVAVVIGAPVMVHLFLLALVGQWGSYLEVLLLTAFVGCGPFAMQAFWAPEWLLQIAFLSWATYLVLVLKTRVGEIPVLVHLLGIGLWCVLGALGLLTYGGAAL